MAESLSPCFFMMEQSCTKVYNGVYVRGTVG